MQRGDSAVHLGFESTLSSARIFAEAAAAMPGPRRSRRPHQPQRLQTSLPFVESGHHASARSSSPFSSAGRAGPRVEHLSLLLEILDRRPGLSMLASALASTFSAPA